MSHWKLSNALTSENTVADMNQPLKDRFQWVQSRIRIAAEKAGRNEDDVHLLAVSKGQSAKKMQQLYALGQRGFAESYLQEAEEKIPHFEASPEWHFIGSLQSNKTRGIAALFHWVHGIDRYKIAKRLNDHCKELNKRLNVCIQVNVSKETAKSGVFPEQLYALASSISEDLPYLKLRGLMAIPAKKDSIFCMEEGGVRHASFYQMRLLQSGLIDKGFSMDTLSMGMSHDFEAAIIEGATMVRVGTALFGERSDINNTLQ